MAKITTYLFIMAGLIILFSVTGIVGIAVSDKTTFLNALYNWKDMDQSDLVSIVGVCLLALAVTGTITLGFTSSGLEKSAIYLLTTALLAFGWDFLIVAKTIANQCLVCSAIATLFFAPFMVMFVISLIDWWRGDYT